MPAIVRPGTEGPSTSRMGPLSSAIQSLTPTPHEAPITGGMLSMLGMVRMWRAMSPFSSRIAQLDLRTGMGAVQSLFSVPWRPSTAHPMATLHRLVERCTSAGSWNPAPTGSLGRCARERVQEGSSGSAGVQPQVPSRDRRSQELETALCVFM
jgi:hypothetical protein